jgi:phospholipid:diacylglycerol acyltransferase
VEDHIEAFVSIAGTHLGVAKAMSAFLSGEMKDTVQMHPAGNYVLERFFSRKDRQKLFRSWAGSASMWMKGGSAIWGDSKSAPDDQEDQHETHGDLISFRETLFSTNISSEEIISSDTERNPMNADDASLWILEHTPSSFQVEI